MPQKSHQEIPLYASTGNLRDWIDESRLANLQSRGLLARVVWHRKGIINRAILVEGAKYETCSEISGLHRLTATWSRCGISGYVGRLEAERLHREATAVGSHTEREWQQIVATAGGKCLRCGASGPGVKLTKDHVVPLAEGGTNYASNLQPLCTSCNSWKGTREIDFRGRS